jgi:GT2 family glycosyltransferase
VTPRVAVVVPNWDGEEHLPACLDSLAAQTLDHLAVVVDNGSTDGSVPLVLERYPAVRLVRLRRNRGFAGGVNAGIEAALEAGCELVALLNNDAVADPRWLEHLVAEADAHPQAGIVGAKVLTWDGAFLDSTGDRYGVWGLPTPRGRGEPDDGRYDDERDLLAASGGASLYRAELLHAVGGFDEAFFAYYEDVDLSLRAQLAGWSVRYAPAARVRHRISGTSSRVPDFARFHVLRNLVYVFVKDVPGPLLPRCLPRFALLYAALVLSGVARGHARVTLRAAAAALLRLPVLLARRRAVQRTRTVPVERFAALLEPDLPPEQAALRRLVAVAGRLRGRPAPR